jgi:predicted membrane protein
LAKFGRLYKAAKLLRLIKLLKLAKDREKISMILTDNLRIERGTERLLLFLMTLGIVGHLVACIWIFSAKVIENSHRANWIYDNQMQDFDNFELYIAAYYFTVTTITTVGYGDITATQTQERLVAILLMIFGVVAFSFATGTLSSILASFDASQA